MKDNLKKSGFKAPENYFENFETELFIRLKEEKFPKKSGFEVPDGYFDSLETTLLEKVNKKEVLSNETGKVISLFPKRYYAYTAAIAACLLVAVTLFNSKQNVSSIDTIQIGLIDKYIEEGNLNLDLYELTSYLEVDDIEIVDFDNQYFSQNTLEEYLLENTDEEILIDQ
jgi:hypothetical protein